MATQNGTGRMVSREVDFCRAYSMEAKEQLEKLFLKNRISYFIEWQDRSLFSRLFGKNDTKEIDFVAIRRDERIYVQVCVQIPAGSDREVGNLMEVRDHYPKYVVTLNEMDTGIENGIRIVHLREFLLAEKW